MREEWKEIHGYEGIYEASTMGRIRSIDRVIKSENRSDFKVNGKIKNQSLCNHGRYYNVCLWKGNKQERMYSHIIIAKTFIKNENPDKYPLVLHKDDIGTNNIVPNLYWGDYQKNSDDKKRNGYHMNRGENNANSKLNKKDIVKIFELRKKHRLSSSQIAIRFNVNRPCIDKILKRQRWKHVELSGVSDKNIVGA